MKETTRFNLVLDADDTAVLTQLAERKRWRRTDVLREALREYGRRQETAVNTPSPTTYIPPMIEGNFGKVATPAPRPKNIACSGCGKVSVAELNGDGIWSYPFALFRYVDGRILCVDCSQRETEASERAKNTAAFLTKEWVENGNFEGWAEGDGESE